ncbi:MAG: divalent metal cation transporter [Clostridia bacterium]|nr:MAG: divalent metal cation transporter [Clostridia bacterium]
MGRLTVPLLTFLAVMGPGIITANVDNDAGGITTYSVAGATLGYQLLWLFLPITLALIVIQEMSARMGAATGKGLAALLRERYGVRVVLLILLGLVLTNLANTISEFAGIAASTELFGLSKYLSVPLAGLLVWGMVVKGSYRYVERIFLAASALYVSYVISGLLARPNWEEVYHSLFIPSFSLEKNYLTIFIGLVGTTIAPWMQFYIQSAVVEKGISMEQYRHSRLDVIVGCFMTDLIAVFIVVACAATLYQHQVSIETAGDAAMALQPLAGRWASQLFAFGLLNASIFAAAILPLATAYSLCEALGFEAGLDKNWAEAPVFYWVYTALIATSVGFILLPGLPLIAVMFWSQVANGFLLPVTLAFMLDLANTPDIMGKYTNSPGFNAVAWATTLLMAGMSLLLVVYSSLSRA